MNKFNTLKLIVGLIFVLANVLQLAHAEKAYLTQETDNLNKIISQFYPDASLSRSQILVAVFEKNIDAFKRNNINVLMKGRLLVLPEESEIDAMGKEQADELLALHTKLYRWGNNENPQTYVASNVEKKKSANIESRQLEQQSKISKLEKESEALKRRLQKLVDEKQTRDEKLREIETSIKESLQTKFSNDDNLENNKTKLNEKNSISDNERNKLQDKNLALQMQLQQSKSELAENIQSNIVLERRLKTIGEEGSESISEEEITPTSHVIKESATPTDSKIEQGSEAGEETSKLVWPLIGLLLFALILWLWRLANKNKIIADDDLEIPMSDGFIEDKFEINQEGIEEPSESSVKLDVADAYIAANDIDAAEDILKQVIEEGDEEQKILAKRTIGSL